MGRSPRLDPQGGIHHIMNRGVDHQPIFFHDADRVEFGRRLAAIHEVFDTETLAYCLMDNHYHLLLRAPGGGLSHAMHHLGSVYTRHTNDRVGRDGPLFRGRFRSIPVTTDPYLLWVTRYIHRNALDVAGVASPADYRWSSYRTYVGLRQRPAFMNLDLVLQFFDDDPGQLAAFTADDPAEQRTRWTRWTPTPIGADDLRCVIDHMIGCTGLATGSDDISPRLFRTVGFALLDRLSDSLLQSHLRQLLDHPTGTARRMASSRARQRLAQDETVRRIVTNVEAVVLEWDRAA